MILNENTNMYEREKYLRNVNSSKTYTFSHDLLNYVSKLQAFIEKEIKENNFNEENLTFVIDFNKIEQYNVIEHPTKYSSEQIHNFLSVIEKNDDIHVGNLILLIKALTNFKNDLLEVLKKSEPEITKVFKKYKTILSIVLLGINFIPTYEKRITTAHYEPVIPDISLFNENNDSIYLIELKKATDLMFNDTFYRNNTLRIKPNFSNAIHQTNVQRNMLAVAAEHYYETIPKSILIYGHLDWESKCFKIKEGSNVNPRKIIIQNLNVVRHNNKDIIIITYDEFIDRIEALINNTMLDMESVKE